MSGHSKWSTIKRKKGAADAKRGKIFSKIVKEITVAVKEGGSADPEANPALRLAVQKAKSNNMPKDNVARAISKASKNSEGLQSMTFEGYGTGGAAVFVECLTDNTKRTVAAVRAIFNKRNGTLGTNGCLSFIFDRKGVFNFPKAELDIEEIELELIDAGCEELEEVEENILVTTSMEDFGKMQNKLEELKIEVNSAGLQRIPTSTKELPLNNAKTFLAMIDAFEDNDDVQEVYHNLEMTEELEASLNE
jgi:YebC/PmpR family DNA-binding regulatory protein